MRKLIYKKIGGWLGLLLLSGLLAGCESNPTAPVDTSPSKTTGIIQVGPTTGGAVVSTVSPLQTLQTMGVVSPATTGQATPTVTVRTVVPITAGPGSAQARDRVTQAVEQLTANQTFRYKLVQSGELKSGTSLTRFEAQGGGEWELPAFHQLLTFSQGGQTQKLEAYGTDKQLFQRVVSLVAWRRVTPLVVGPFPDLKRLESGANFKAMGQESLNGQSALKFVWEMPASGFFPAAGGPESLGALTVSNLYLAFDPAKASPAQATIWVNPANSQFLRYRLDATLTNGDTTLVYGATYDYYDLSSPLSVTPPNDLPR